MIIISLNQLIRVQLLISISGLETVIPMLISAHSAVLQSCQLRFLRTDSIYQSSAVLKKVQLMALMTLYIYFIPLTMVLPGRDKYLVLTEFTVRYQTEIMPHCFKILPSYLMKSIMTAKHTL